MYADGAVVESISWQHTGDCFGLSCVFEQPADPKVFVEVEQLISFDGGTTWGSGGKCLCRGGIFTNPITGELETKSGFSTFLYKNKYDDNGKIVDRESVWKDPLVKTIIRISGGPTKMSVDEVVAVIDAAVVP